MFTVALIGADGAGKTTIARRLADTQPVPLRYIYMGLNPEASTHMLPTTRLLLAVKRLMGRDTYQGGPPDVEATRRKSANAGPVKRSVTAVKSILRTGNQVGEEWFRQVVAWYYQRRGLVVLFDRHFYCDYYGHDMSAEASHLSAAQRVHGLLLRKFYPKPDLIVLLDAPAEVLFARKAEGTVELIESRRQEYLRLREAEGASFELVDASQAEELVMQDVVRILSDFRQRVTAGSS
jgi:thymidylate kinase